MIIIGVDFHPEFQQTASVDTDTGDLQEKRLAHLDAMGIVLCVIKTSYVRNIKELAVSRFGNVSLRFFP